MKNLEISATKDYFTLDDKPFFYLADTVWCAFSFTFEEWQEYLEYRRMQGFNVLQIGIFNCFSPDECGDGILPFKTDSNSKFDYYNINHEYFDKAQRMLDMAVNQGFRPALTVLWHNCVKGTYGTTGCPENAMPLGALKNYVEYAAKVFKRFNPIYLVSGDTNFETDESIEYYMTALEIIKTVCPDSLTTMHLGTFDKDRPIMLPDAFTNSKHLDFYMYQSGHYEDSPGSVYKTAQDLAYKQAIHYYEKPVKRPVINGEPCYEGHGYGHKYPRFSAYHVRKAIWQSLLSGAKAGITYGAHGVWSQHKHGKNFKFASFSGMPYDWRTALRFDGAWDAAFAKWVFEVYNLFDIEPVTDMIKESHEVRVSISRDGRKVIIYIPYNIDIKIDMDLSEYDFVLVNLEDKLIAKPLIVAGECTSLIKMHDFNVDVILIGVKP